jgi:hypothetical protein
MRGYRPEDVATFTAFYATERVALRQRPADGELAAVR